MTLPPPRAIKGTFKKPGNVGNRSSPRRSRSSGCSPSGSISGHLLREWLLPPWPLFFRQEIFLHNSINRESRQVDNHNQSTITGATCRCHISLRQQTEQILMRSRDHLHGEKTGNAGRLGKVPS